MMPTISLQGMLDVSRHGAAEFSCVQSVAAALPPDCQLVRLHEAFWTLPAAQRLRAARNPLASARLVARMLHLRRVQPTPDVPCWGIVKGRHDTESFAVWTGQNWWAASQFGVSRVHPTRVKLAWEIR